MTPRPTTTPRPTRRAYTLVEMLIVVTILGIAGTMVLPSMQSLGVLRTQAAVRAVVADITYAQMDALGYQEPRAVVFDADANMYTLCEVVGESIDVEADALYDPKGPNERHRLLLDEERFGGAFISEISLNSGTALIFDEQGAPIAAPGSTTLSDGGSITITGPDSRFRIDIAAFTGRVTVVQLD